LAAYQGKVAALNRCVGKLKYLLMAYTLGNKCAKNLCKLAVLVQLIIKNVVTCFLRHSVVTCICPHSKALTISKLWWWAAGYSEFTVINNCRFKL